MSSRRLKLTTILLIIFCALLAGCGQKIVRQPFPHPGARGPYAAAPVAEQELQAVQASLKHVYFDYDQYTLSPQAQADLQYNADLLRRVPQIALVAEGHCDERGTAEYNLALGDRRARSSVEFLTALGIDPRRFSIVSYGSELPVDPGHNEAAWSKNRRVYFRVSR
jgi:peptidoglycan-associated lipoprotein